MARIVQRNESYLNQKMLGHQQYSKRNLRSAYKIIVLGIIFEAFLIWLDFSFFWTILLFLGTALIFVFWIYLHLSDYSLHELHFFRFRSGQAGERRVLNELVKLPDIYTVYCDAQVGFGNIDFVVQKGNLLVLIEVKNIKGWVEMHQMEIFVNGRLFPHRNPLLQMVNNDYDIKKAFALSGAEGYKFISVLVFSNPKAFVNAPIKIDSDFYIIHLRGLLKFLTII